MAIEGPTVFPIMDYVKENYMNEPWVFMMLIYHILNFIWESGVWLGQVRGILTNITSNEMINMTRYQHFKDSRGRIHNPFDKGVSNNIKEFCFEREKWFHEFEIK